MRLLPGDNGSGKNEEMADARPQGLSASLTRQERDEALKTLYRLREKWTGPEDAPGGVLEAVEKLIKEYEQVELKS